MGNFFKNKNILLVSPEPWNHLYISKHHYAIELAKNNNVYFLNPPARSFGLSRIGILNLWVVDYTRFPKGLRFFPAILQRFLMKIKFRKLEEMAGVQFDCIWSFDNSVFFDFNFLERKILSISHIVDYSQDFQFSKAASTATLCLGVSPNIVEKLSIYNNKSFLMPHGVSLNHDEVGVELPGNNKVKALYAGNLDSKYISRPLLLTLVDQHPDVDFIFLGSGGRSWLTKENCFLGGVIPAEKLLNYLVKANLLLIAYDSVRYPNQITNSHKLLDYLASGVVVVSTFLKDYADKRHLVEMANSEEEFINLFELVVKNLANYNTPEKMAMRREFASRNSYAARLYELENILSTDLQFLQ